jgi:hypothetical protein
MATDSLLIIASLHWSMVIFSLSHLWRGFTSDVSPIWECGWWTKGLKLNSGNVEQTICTSWGVVLVSCVSGVSPVVPHQQVDYCGGTLTSQEPHPSYWQPDSQWVAARVLWCKLQYRRECVTEMAIGHAVTKRVKDEWLEGEGKNATVKIAICNAGLDKWLSQFGTEQLACSQTHYNEEFDIHIEDLF